MEEKEMLELTNENEEEQETLKNKVETEETSEDVVEDIKSVNMTQEEFDNAMKARLDRQKRSLEKDFAKEMEKYARTRQILSATFGTDDIEELNQRMIDYYTEEGIEIPEEQPKGLSDEEYEILGTAEAQKIIDLGEEDIVDELNRMKDLGVENLDSKEKYIYKKLYETLEHNKQLDDLKKNGIDASILEDKEFQKYEKKFSKDIDLVEKVNLYRKLTQTEIPEKIGSMESESNKQEKDFYTPEEVVGLSPSEWKKPGEWEKVMASQKKWK